jgi:4-amino-4-deoxy-L-arabinose transferase-like glycosyltransferase
VRVARVVLALATLWFGLAASWELFGPLLAGHYASTASMGIIGENMLKWGIAGPVWQYTSSRPDAALYYCHHPWGIFWTTAAFLKVFGHHDYVCRLPAVLLSIATPPLLYAVGRSIWRPAAGAMAALAFTVLPIALAFANFNALEVPVMAWGLLATWGFVRLTQTSKRRYLVASLLGLLLALNADWPAFVLVGELLAFGLFRAVLLPPRTLGAFDARRYMQWWALAATLAVLTLAAYVAAFHSAGKLSDLFDSYGQRSTGNALSLRAVLRARRYWIELSFTPLAIVIGKVGAIVALVRLIVYRSEHEVVPLVWLGMAVVQYVVFKQGADIHIFWPHYFAAYFALAIGALVATLAPLLGRVERLGRERGAVLAMVLVALPLLAILRDGVPALKYARETGGRFNEKGLLIHSDGAKTAFLHGLSRGALGGVVDMHAGMKTTWAQVWALGGRVVQQNRPIPKRAGAPSSNAYLADSRFLPDRDQAELARQFHVVTAGPFWAIDPAEPWAPMTAHAFVEREPTWWQWALVSGTEPQRTLEADPFLTWQLRTHFDQPAEAPTEAPRTLERQLIAHNIARTTNDLARADAILIKIQSELRPLDARFDDGTELVGARFQPGARSLLTLVLRAGGPLGAEVALQIHSRVVEPARLSTTMADPVERDVGLPPAIAPSRWKRGFLYAVPVPIRKRPGTEVFSASLVAPRGHRAPRLVSGAASVEVLRLPR